MRILIVNKYARVTGGADEHCLRLTRGLRERRHEVAWLSTADPDNVELNGVFVRPTVTHDTRAGLGRRRRFDVARHALWNPEVAAGAQRLLDTFSPDLVHAHKLYPQLSVAPILIAARRGVPVVQTLHDYELISASPLDHRGSRLDRTEERTSYRLLNTSTGLLRRSIHRRCVDRYVSVSSFVAAAYRRHGVPSTVIPNAARSGPAGPRRSFSEREGVAFAGRLSPEKGVMDVIRLAERAPSIGVRFAGRGPLEGTVRAAAERLPNLAFLGWLNGDELDALLSSCRVAVVPSLWAEPHGLAALEAMRVGTPVVAYDRGGLASAVAGAGAGRVVKPCVDELVRACLELHEEESTWKRLAERSLATVEGPHSADAWLEATCRLYEDVIASRRIF